MVTPHARTRLQTRTRTRRRRRRMPRLPRAPPPIRLHRHAQRLPTRRTPPPTSRTKTRGVSMTRIHDRTRRARDQEQLDLDDEQAAQEGLDPWIHALPCPPWADTDDLAPSHPDDDLP